MLYVARTGAALYCGAWLPVAYAHGRSLLPSLHNLSKSLNLGNDLGRPLGDIAASDSDHQVAWASDPGDRWCRLIPDRFISHLHGARSDRIGHHGAVDSGNRILSIAADVHNDGLVCLLQRVSQLAPKVPGPGIEVRLKAHNDSTIADTGASGDQGIEDLSGVMSVIVAHPDVFWRANQLEAPVRAQVSGEFTTGAGLVGSEPDGDRVRRRRVEHVVVPRYR